MQAQQGKAGAAAVYFRSAVAFLKHLLDADLPGEAGGHDAGAICTCSSADYGAVLHRHGG